MLFPTIEFALFFIIVFSLNWATIKLNLLRKIILTIASYFFYGYWDWRFMFLLFSCSASNYLFGYLIGVFKNDRLKKATLVISVIFNLSILGFFKYYGFFVTSFNNLLLNFGIDSHIPLLNIVLPVGISFFTFQAMSYVIDVYRGEIKYCKSPIDILLFISFFPQLVAGPIVRAKDFIPQLDKIPEINNIKLDKALILILVGLFKKMIVANYLSSLLVDKVFANPGSYSTVEVLLAVYGYAVQIYCDFSAYSDIAIGVAYLFGYEFPKNFDHPYKSQSLQEFWRRWHISLSTWLKDYLYIPLGGSRKGKVRTYINLALTMLLGGLWHGASFNFIIWGGLHGGYLAVERGINQDKKSYRKKNIIVQFLSVFLIFNFVCFCWIFFRSPTLTSSMEYIKSFANFGVETTLITPFVLFLIFTGIAVHFIPDKFSFTIKKVFEKIPIPVIGVAAGLFFIAMSSFSPEGVSPFIYFQF